MVKINGNPQVVVVVVTSSTLRAVTVIDPFFHLRLICCSRSLDADEIYIKHYLQTQRFDLLHVPLTSTTVEHITLRLYYF